MSERVRYEELSPSEQKKYWEGLYANPAWVSLCQALQDQADALQKEIIFSPVNGSEAAYGMERLKGQLVGKLSVSDTAEAMYQTACAEAAEKTNQNEGDA